MDERLRFVARLLDGEKMAALCREFGISRKTGYKILSLSVPKTHFCELRALRRRPTSEQKMPRGLGSWLSSASRWRRGCPLSANSIPLAQFSRPTSFAPKARWNGWVVVRQAAARS
jgi:hypothetical protein